MPNEPSSKKIQEKGTGIKAILQSAFASAFGVQSRKNLSRDFKQGRPADFIVAGIIGTVLFVTILVVIVKTILTVSTG